MKGPKAILSEAIANALSEYFVIDDPHAKIDSQLSGDAEIVLRDIALKERLVQLNPVTSATIAGTIQLVSFQWHWGKDNELEGANDWVRNAKLTIEGLQFSVNLRTNKATEQKPAADFSKKGKSGFFVDYVNNQIQRIMDTITLAIRSVELRIILPPNDNELQSRALTWGASAVTVQPYGRTDTCTSKQDLSITDIFCSVSSSAGQAFPLMASVVAYKMTIVRSNEDEGLGMARGYRVLGKPLDDVKGNDNEFVFYAGQTQLEFIMDLMDLVFPNKREGREDVKDNHPKSSSPAGSTLQSPTPSENKHSTEPSLHGTNEASFFQLPMPSVSVILPNETKISLTGVVCKYRTDRTLRTLEGRAGLLVDDFQLVSFGETSFWQIDHVHKRMVVADLAAAHNHHHDELVAFLHSRPLEIGRMAEGFTQVINIRQNYRLKKEENATATGGPEMDVEMLPETTIGGWIFHLRGMLGILAENEGGEVTGECTIRGVTASSELLSVDVIAIDSLFIPGIAKLKGPIENIALTFDGSVLDVKMGAVVATLDVVPEEKSELEKLGRSVTATTNTSMEDRLPFAQKSSTSRHDSPLFVMPCGLTGTCERLVLLQPASVKPAVTFAFIQVALGPDEVSADVERPAIRGAIAVSEIRHYLIGATECNMTALVYTDDFNTIHQYNCTCRSVSLAAGYSVFDWQRLFNGIRERILLERNKAKKKRIRRHSIDEKSVPLKLPYARIGQMKFRIVVTSDLIAVNDSTIHVGAFHGKRSTVFDDILQFYFHHVLKQTPTLIPNIDALGINLTEGASSFIGSMLGAAVFKGLGGLALPVGGMLAVSGLHGIKNTIKAGKAGRGAAEDDRHTVGDFLRGAQCIARENARKGARRRGKGGDQLHDPLDWAVGAACDVSKYAQRNKRKLGAAGAGTLGMGVGLAISDPFAGMVGGFITWATVDKAMALTEERRNKLGQLRHAEFDVVSESFEQTLQKDAMQGMQHMDKAIIMGTFPENTASVNQGTLLKRRDFFKWDWNAYFFVVQDGELMYYQTSEATPLRDEDLDIAVFVDNEGGPVKSIKLLAVVIVPDEQLSIPEDNRYVFTISVNEQREPLWVLAANSLPARQKWLDTLGSAKAKAAINERSSLTRTEVLESDLGNKCCCHPLYFDEVQTSSDEEPRTIGARDVSFSVFDR